MSDEDEKVIFTDIEQDCRKSIKSISDKFLVDKIYNSNDIGWMIDHLTNNIIKELQQISDNFKYVLTVVLLQNEDSGFTQNNSLFFDNDTDGFICEKYSYENITSIYNFLNMTSELIEVKKEEVSESSILTLDNSTANSTEIKINELMDMKIEKDKIYDNETIYGNNIKDKNPKKLGSTYAFFYLNGDPLIVIGPHWPFFAGLTSFITIIGFLYFHYLWVLLNPVIGYIGVFVFSFYTISYTITFLINPGIPSRKYSVSNLTPSEIKQKKICSLCKIYLVPGLKIAHCYECRVCVEGHDHHCPWTSKCVGKRNLIPFYGFVISIFLIFFYLIFATCTLGIFINPKSS